MSKTQIPYYLKKQLNKNDYKILENYAENIKKLPKNKEINEKLFDKCLTDALSSTEKCDKDFFECLHNDIKAYGKKTELDSSCFSDWLNSISINHIQDKMYGGDSIRTELGININHLEPHMKWLKDIDDCVVKYINDYDKFRVFQYSWIMNPEEISMEEYVEICDLGKDKYNAVNGLLFAQNYIRSSKNFEKQKDESYKPTIDFMKKVTNFVDEILEKGQSDTVRDVQFEVFQNFHVSSIHQQALREAVEKYLILNEKSAKFDNSECAY